MKKSLLTTVFLVVVISVKAQLWLGGNVGIQTNTQSIEMGHFSTNQNIDNFTFAPEVGYEFSNGLGVGMKFGFLHEEGVDIPSENINEQSTGTGNTIYANPFMRYSFAKIDKFSAFIEFGLGFGTTHVVGTSDYLDNVKKIGFDFTPGIAYLVSPRVKLVAHLGGYNYEKEWTKLTLPNDPKNKIKISNINSGMTFMNTVSFGAYFYL